jgi:hypothetical protein
MNKAKIKQFIVSGWPSSGKAVTVLSLVILPIIAILSSVLYDMVLKEILLRDVYYAGGSVELTVLEYSIRFVQISIFIMIIFLFPPYPAPIPIGKYFENRGYETAVDEYQTAKIILYIAVPLFIILTVLPYLDPLIQRYSSITLTLAYRESTFSLTQTVTLFIVLAGILKIILTVYRKKFRFYFAVGCFEKAKAKGEKETDKMSYFIKGLEAYNAYLRRNLKVQIGDLKKIISKILGLPHQRKIHKVDVISDSFIKNALEIHNLEPLRTLQEFLIEREKVDGKDERIDENDKKIDGKDIQQLSLEGLLTQQPTIDKIKDTSSFFAVTAIPLAISIVDLYQKVVR